MFLLQYECYNLISAEDFVYAQQQGRPTTKAGVSQAKPES